MARAAFLGLGGAVSALLVWIEPQLSSLHMLGSLRWLLSIMIGLGVALIASAASNRARRSDTAAKLDLIDRAVIGGVSRRASDREGAEYGLRAHSPVGGPANVEAISDRLKADPFVYVIGKNSRVTRAAAFAALRSEHLHNYRLLAPVDADGLQVLLENQTQLVGALGQANADSAARDTRGWRRPGKRLMFRLVGCPCGPAVLWLDGFERFAGQLDLHSLRVFLRRVDLEAPPPRAPGRRLARYWSKRSFPSAHEPQEHRLLITMDVTHYKALSSGDDEAARRARPLLVLKQPTRLASESTATDEPGPDPEQPRPDARDDRPVPSLRTPAQGSGTSLVLSAIFLALALSAGVVISQNRWSLHSPPSLESQANSIEQRLPDCAETLPATSAELVAVHSYWIMPVDEQYCGASDYVRIYANDYKHLDPIVTERPLDGGIWRFQCEQSDDCLVNTGGRTTIIVGAFLHDSAGIQIALPIVLYDATDAPQGIQMLAPKLPDPPKTSISPTSLTLALGAPPDFASKGNVCSRPAELCGHPPTYITALSAGEDATRYNASVPDNAVILIAGYAVQGPYYQPKTVVTRAFVLEYTDGDSPPLLFHTALCRSASNQDFATLSQPSIRPAVLQTQMQKLWTGSITCGD